MESMLTSCVSIVELNLVGSIGKLHEDNETTAKQLQAKLATRNVCVRSRAQLGWIYRWSVYCQLYVL